MKRCRVGTYLGRFIEYSEISTFNDLPQGLSFLDATLLIDVEVPFSSEDEEHAFFRRLGSASPLAVLVAGVNAARVWSRLVDFWELERPILHIMTAYTDTRDVIEAVRQLFWATWPNEERWDDWRSCLVLLVGDDSRRKPLLDAVASLADKSSL